MPSSVTEHDFRSSRRRRGQLLASAAMPLSEMPEHHCSRISSSATRLCARRKMELSVMRLLHTFSFCIGEEKAYAERGGLRSGRSTKASSEMSSMKARLRERSWPCWKICWISGERTFLHWLRFRYVRRRQCLFSVEMISPVICGQPCREMASMERQPSRLWKGDSQKSNAASVRRWQRSSLISSKRGQPCRMARTTELRICAQSHRSRVTRLGQFMPICLKTLLRIFKAWRTLKRSLLGTRKAIRATSVTAPRSRSTLKMGSSRESGTNLHRSFMSLPSKLLFSRKPMIMVWHRLTRVGTIAHSFGRQQRLDTIAKFEQLGHPLSLSWLWFLPISRVNQDDYCPG
mmetsp:Transcript_31390/g.69204  ORF Transcript_31390/g.69204 Transcript_31390/m.69204 type:complete len:346 (-) Transcript_31390:94-1131(-)